MGRPTPNLPAPSAAGDFLYLELALLRLNADGTPDTGFGTNGEPMTPAGSSDHFAAYSVAIQGDGKIVATRFTRDDISGEYDIAVARYIVQSGLEERTYELQDHNFNVTAVADAFGTVVERYVYDPYGEPTVLDANWDADSDDISDIGQVYLHQGGRRDVVTSFYYFRKRDLDAAAGRWNRVDSIANFTTDSSYLYSNDSPVVLPPMAIAACNDVLFVAAGPDANFEQQYLPPLDRVPPLLLPSDLAPRPAVPKPAPSLPPNGANNLVDVEPPVRTGNSCEGGRVIHVQDTATWTSVNAYFEGCAYKDPSHPDRILAGERLVQQLWRHTATQGTILVFKCINGKEYLVQTNDGPAPKKITNELQLDFRHPCRPLTERLPKDA